MLQNEFNSDPGFDLDFVPLYGPGLHTLQLDLQGSEKVAGHHLDRNHVQI